MHKPGHESGVRDAMTMEHEKRSAVRDYIRLPVHIQENCDGVTRDFSVTGVYVHADCELPVGSPVNITIDVGMDRQTVHLLCSGTVMRVDKAGQGAGMAICISSTEIDPE